MLEDIILLWHHIDEIISNTKQKLSEVLCIENDVPKYFAKYHNLDIFCCISNLLKWNAFIPDDVVA